MIQVIKFTKKCPHCKEPLRFTQKMWCSWESCQNDKCPYLETQVLKTRKIAGIEVEDVPVPYQCNFVNRGHQPRINIKGNV